MLRDTLASRWRTLQSSEYLRQSRDRHIHITELGIDVNCGSCFPPHSGQSPVGTDCSCAESARSRASCPVPSNCVNETSTLTFRLCDVQRETQPLQHQCAEQLGFNPELWSRGSSEPVSCKVNTEWNLEIESVNNDNSHSWVRTSQSLNKLVTDLIDKEHDDNEHDTTKTETFALKTKIFTFADQRAKQNQEDLQLHSHSQKLHKLEKNLDLEPGVSIERTQWQKD